MEKAGNVSAKKVTKQYETAIRFARMYGVRETLEPLPFIENEVIVTEMVQWAKEYLESEHCDEFQGNEANNLIEFFVDKCEGFIRERRMKS